MEPRSLGDVKRLLADVLRDTDAAPEVRDEHRIVDDLGLDSLQMISFLLGVEDCFRVALDFERLDLSKLGTVAEFAVFVDSVVAAQRA